ncbi:UTP--glucose-1-phosphate uridylyltransferase [Corynebacterium ulceribovis]|uniref:UTP--glucose-1-phosphate uridylyltransferase n=1 Tax=Corynebacterium ulceribovis TaxID=487732 RepID=UPI000363B7D1|nr:UTP--glucose-1-phosphate uridylyltransferase [Corynebacterium ulceribovis]
MTQPHADSVPFRTVIVPAAGLGTRFLPATKTVPKELLPVVDTPGIELIAEEAAKAGVKRLAVITAPNKDGVMAHFQRHTELEATLEERGKSEQLRKVQRAANIIDAVPVLQEQPLGLGHAVLQGEAVLDDDETAVGVMLPDDLVLPMGVMEDMAAVREKLGGSVLCALEVPRSQVYNYGVFEVSDEATGMDRTLRVTGMVEKPSPEEAPSNLVATGRYLLDRAIFDALRRTKPGRGGEIQLTDAIEMLIQEGHPVHILVHDGVRHDLGNPGGYIAACVHFGLQDETYGPTLREFITKRLAEDESN